jgi:hypothetical protein
MLSDEDVHIRAPRRLRINILVPLCARDRAMLVGVSLDQARINRKAFTPDQAGRNAITSSIAQDAEQTASRIC